MATPPENDSIGAAIKDATREGWRLYKRPFFMLLKIDAALFVGLALGEISKTVF